MHKFIISFAEKFSYQVSLNLRVNTIKEAISLIQTCYIVSNGFFLYVLME